MAALGNNVKMAFLKGLEALGKGASNMATNAHQKLNEINLETRRRELLSEIPVRALDLRAGAAMVIAGLGAEGTTVLEDIHYIERGYENFVGKLRSLGADIALVSEPDEPGSVKSASAG